MRALFVIALVVLAPAVAGARDVALAPFVAEATGAAPASIPARDADLAALAARADARFGVERAPEAYAALTQLDPRLSAVTADLLWALLWAADERDAAYASVTDAELAAALAGASAPDLLVRIDQARVRAAAVSLAHAVDEARPVLVELAAARPAASALALALAPALAPPSAAAPAPAPAVDLFPILGIDPLGVPNVFPHDYFLSIDLGGDDLYDNNAGGSIIQRGRSVGDPATWGPTVPVPDTPVVENGDVFFDAGGDIIIGGEFEEGEAVHSTTLAIDVAGNDVYGVYKAPSAQGIDQRCTAEPVVRRVVIQGSGGGGIGMLVDLDGDDRYRAKTIGQGAGHVAGVGALFDARGSDLYTGVRTVQGVGLLGGVGVLVDPEGSDAYTLAAPAGGIFNQPDMRCDATLRVAMGVGALSGAGLFYEGGGDDVYRAGAKAMGHADPQSLGFFVDARGADDYGGFVARSNGGTVMTTPVGGLGLFRDLE